MTDALTDVLRPAWMGTEQIPVDAIAKVAAKAAGSLKAEHIPNIVRLAFGEARGDFAGWIVTSFNGEETIVDEAQDLRQQRLAVAVLLTLLEETSGAHVDQAALSVLTLDFATRESGHPRLVSAAQERLRKARADNAGSPDRPRVPAQSTALKEALDALEAAEWGVYRTAITEVANEVTKLRQMIARHLLWVEQREVPMQEQLELLWWVTSGISASTRRPLADLPHAAAPVIAALDVAALAPRAPGPPSASGLLRFALAAADVRPDHPAKLDSVSAEMTGLSVADVPSPPASDADLFPVLSALGDAAPGEPRIHPEQLSLPLAEETLAERYLFNLMNPSESA
jgi:hypothetical protein